MRLRVRGLYASLCLSLIGLNGCTSATPEVIIKKDCSHWDSVEREIDSSLLVQNLGWVSDHADILSAKAEAKIAEELQQLESATQHQVVVVTVETLHRMPIEDYARALGNSWGVGRVAENDGVVLLVAPNELKLRIAVGCGLETVLTNQKASDIIQTVILPDFRHGNYEKGISEGVQHIISTLENG